MPSIHHVGGRAARVHARLRPRSVDCCSCRDERERSLGREKRVREEVERGTARGRSTTLSSDCARGDEVREETLSILYIYPYLVLGQMGFAWAQNLGLYFWRRALQCLASINILTEAGTLRRPPPKMKYLLRWFF